MKDFVLTVVFFWSHIGAVLCVCKDRTPLGMWNGLIKSNQISAESSYSRDYNPAQARIYSSKAWCGGTGSRIGDYKTKWFQVHFNTRTTVNGIAIRGDPGGSSNYVTKFKLQYSIDGNTFQDFGDEFAGNSDNKNVVYNWFTTSMSATHVRLYATQIFRSWDDQAHPCMRIELYGCLQNNIHLPLGMARTIITNSQLSRSTGYNKENARLFHPGTGMYRPDNNPVYLQIDFFKQKTITGISIQGSFGNGISNQNFVKKYKLSYSYYGTQFSQLNQEIQVDASFGEEIVFNTLSQLTFIKSLRIRPTSCEGNCGMKVEVYGYDAVCSNTLTQMTITGASGKNITIDSPTAWCKTQASTYLYVAFKSKIVVSGIILQGDSNNNGWVKTYKIQHGSPAHLRQNLIGVSERISPLSVNWLNPYIVTNHLYIIPTSCSHDRCCMRLQLKGCQIVLAKPHSIKASLSSSEIRFTWKAPVSHPLSVSKYHIKITASKDFPHTHSLFFNTIYTTTYILSYILEYVTFAAARVRIVITADIHDITKSSEPFDFYVQPKDPPPPGLATSSNGENTTIVTLTSSSDIHGPISYYEIVISTTRKSNLPTLINNQKESELKNLDYFLAATVKDLPADGIKYYFVEGQENIDGLNAKISVIGKYYIYARAVINGKDITKYGFQNINYNGVLSQNVVIERNALKTLVPEVLNRTKTSVALVKGPLNLKYHYIIMMKVNKTTWQKKEPKFYQQNDLKTYETADYNQPYIAGVFNKTQLLNVSEFVLGNNITYTLPSKSGRRRRRSIIEYRNGPLVGGETYAVFQRLNVQDDLYSTLWSKEFVAPKDDTQAAPKPGKQNPTSSNIGLIAGIAAAGVIVLIAIIVVIIFIKRRRKPLKRSGDDRDSATSIKLKSQDEFKMQENNYDEINAGPSNESYYNIPLKPKFPPLSIQEFLSFYLEQKDNVSSDIVKQYKSVPMERLHDCEVGLMSQNKDKNRYLNVTAYDHTRVVLQEITGEETSDYINANYIQNYSGEVEYIAAQGPKKETIFDFWRMVLGEKPAAVIMLTNIVEDGKPKCAQYWPKNNGKRVYNGIEVEVMEVQVYADYVIRKMKVSYEYNKHQFMHLHFTSWPDHGCPEYPTLLLNFCYRVRQLIPYESGKQLLVHCSAGVGRTGSYIIIDAMLHLMKTKHLVDIYNYFESIRQNRVQMVQTVEQYKFVHSAIYEALCCGYTGVAASIFPETFRNLISKKQGGKFLLEIEFERLNSVNIPFGEGNFKTAMLEENASKNRYPDILAGDFLRVFLPQTPNSTDYINAVFVNGYKKKDGIIATQAPLVGTLNDFWVVVMERDVTTIVMLNSTDENYHNFPSFCPVQGSEDFGAVTVRVESNARVGNINMQSFIVSDNTTERKVNKLQLNWPNHDIPDSNSLLTLIGEVLKSQQFYGDGTILVTCSDGANRSGTFIACMNALDQLKVEQHIDVFQTVRRMRLVRPEFVENLRQYQLIYTVLNTYLDSFSTYSNFN
ncbi:tyrosine-protein phosphatase Lar-like [Hydractinia symbiolongicarpus]|uniref:tyrosine-protein phosphatase Lar-like n=1 Tax=Hydractinia symbiolongicarpus TaxID=13093 RepID=UPI00255044D9|nr:tyrosine-protein phosphatase Lar-like [Hydractinia symbiolongicarpus]